MKKIIFSLLLLSTIFIVSGCGNFCEEDLAQERFLKIYDPTTNSGFGYVEMVVIGIITESLPCIDENENTNKLFLSTPECKKHSELTGGTINIMYKEGKGLYEYLELWEKDVNRVLKCPNITNNQKEYLQLFKRVVDDCSFTIDSFTNALLGSLISNKQSIIMNKISMDAFSKKIMSQISELNSSRLRYLNDSY